MKAHKLVLIFVFIGFVFSLQQKNSFGQTEISAQTEPLNIEEISGIWILNTTDQQSNSLHLRSFELKKDFSVCGEIGDGDIKQGTWGTGKKVTEDGTILSGNGSYYTNSENADLLISINLGKLFDNSNFVEGFRVIRQEGKILLRSMSDKEYKKQNQN